MLKNLLFIVCTLCTVVLVAQSPLRPQHLKMKPQPAPYKKAALTGAEPGAGGHVNPNLPVIGRTEMEETVGETFYDLQSNSATPRRLASHTDGTRYATWTMGMQATAYPDRGTGLNILDPNSGSWGDYPDARIEDTRTGWPNIGILADGSPVIVAHRAGPEALYFSRMENDVWVHNTIPSAAPSGVIWPRMAIGGPDGNTAHVLGITYPTGNGGAVYEGVDGHVLYYRSLDGGVTWDKQDIILPEINKDYYTRMDADSYAIDADGNTVVVALFADLGDVKVSRSDDNGETWTTWTVKDFPIDQYTVDQGYTTADIPFDPDAPDTLAIQSSDNTGAVLIDKSGMAHIWYGEMYYLDATLTDNNFSFFPAWMGLRYWNETFGEDSTQLLIPGIIDANGNDTLDIASTDEIAAYFSSMTSHPTVGTDADGNIFLAYSGVTENYVSDFSTPNAGQHTRHIYMTHSEDLGATWSDPFDVIRDDLVLEADLINLYETMFPAMDKRVDSKVHILYQGDFEPGLSVRGDMDAAAVNYMNYLAVDLEEFGLTGTEVVNPAEFAFEVSPNPASGFVKINYELPTAGQTGIRIYDMMGRQVKSISTEMQAAGSYQAFLNVDNFSGGIYLVQLQSGDKIATKKLLVN